MSESFLSAMESPKIERMSSEANDAYYEWAKDGTYVSADEFKKWRDSKMPFHLLNIGWSFSIYKTSIFFNAANSSCGISMRRYNKLYRVKFVKIKHKDRFEFARIG